MKSIVKTMMVVLIALTIVLPLVWGAETQMMPMPWPWPTPGPEPTPTPTLPIWNMMGGGSGSFRVADLNGDGKPEIVTIYANTYLVIYDNQGNIKTAKLLPNIAGNGTFGGMMGKGSKLEVADIDGDDTPEIITIYGDGIFYGSYLVILNNEGDLKDYLVLPPPYNLNQ